MWQLTVRQLYHPEPYRPEPYRPATDRPATVPSGTVPSGNSGMAVRRRPLAERRASNTPSRPGAIVALPGRLGVWSGGVRLSLTLRVAVLVPRWQRHHPPSVTVTVEWLANGHGPVGRMLFNRFGVPELGEVQRPRTVAVGFIHLDNYPLQVIAPLVRLVEGNLHVLPV